VRKRRRKESSSWWHQDLTNAQNLCILSSDGVFGSLTNGYDVRMRIVRLFWAGVQIESQGAWVTTSSALALMNAAYLTWDARASQLCQ
jgi:hypothetical protein